MKTGLDNVLLPTLFKVFDNIVQHCYTCLQASSMGSTMLNNIVDNVGSKTLFKPVFIRPFVRFCQSNSVTFSYNTASNGLICRIEGLR